MQNHDPRNANVLIHVNGQLVTRENARISGVDSAIMLDIARIQSIACGEKNLSLTELYSADEAFTSGTMGELTPILEADGRVIGTGKPGPMTKRLQ